MSGRLVLLLFLSSLLIFAQFSPTLSADEVDDDLDEDLSFLEEDDEPQHSTPGHISDSEDFDEDGYASQSDSDEPQSDGGHYSNPEIDEKDVVVLKERNFSDVIENNRYVMVEFYAPWCGHCQALAPEYAAAATALKEENVVLAKVDATEENQLAHEYDVQGFPTVFFFMDGVHKPYPGQRTKDAIVTWIKKKIGPGVYNITSTEDAEHILTSENAFVLGFLDSLVGPESKELSAASKLEDNINFYQTVNPDVAKLFNIDPKVKRPALVLLKKEAEKLSNFDGKFIKSEIAEFVSANRLPLVTNFTRESAPLIFENTVKNQLLLFVTASDSERIIPVFQEAAKSFKGKIIFVYVDLDNEEIGKPVAEYFGLTGDAPKVIAYTGNEDARKFILDGDVTLDKVKAFGEDFLEGKLKPLFKSDPIPEFNDGDVKIVVGNNFDEIVLDESKDVLLEVYAPWCGHCQALEPTYNKLAKHLRGIESLVIAKMDGTSNEHHRAKVEGFPTLLFFPAGQKSSDPISVDADRTVVALYKFLKKHASIPFKLQKPASKPEISDTKKSDSPNDVSPSDVKDEL